MAHDYYVCWYRLDRQDRYLIWYSNDTDGVVTDGQNRVPSFKTLADLHLYAEAHNLSILEESPSLHNLDVLAVWLKSPSKDVDCKEFLSTWHLFQDVSASVKGDFDPDREQTTLIYYKLFWGNNLPTVTPEGEEYTPAWTEDELKKLYAVLGHGLDLFRRSMKVMGETV